MKKNVVGIFATSFEAMKAIDSLKHDGIDQDHICVVANDDLKSNTIEEKTGVAVEDEIQDKAGRNTLWEELTSFFTKKDDGIKTYSDHLLDLGMTEADVNRYANEVENGHILVLVDSDADHGRIGLLSTENIPLNHTFDVKVHGEKVDNFTTGDRFDRDKTHPQARMHPPSDEKNHSEQHAGRPKERQNGMDLKCRQREYEELVNPFENRYPADFSRTDLQKGSNDHQDYGHNPS
ncbi:general stress protein [Siminovitchia acidinfaciens]|nr:general stress protein [Siminovitchia acidinfaciens]